MSVPSSELGPPTPSPASEYVELKGVRSTKYVHIKSTTVYAPRRNWDSPNPFLASECSPPPRNRGRGHTSLRVGGWGESQFRRGTYTAVLFICTYFVVRSNTPLRVREWGYTIRTNRKEAWHSVSQILVSSLFNTDKAVQMERRRVPCSILPI